MELILELAKPIGNILAKKIFANKVIEENSLLSDALGMLAIILFLVIAIWLLFSLFN